MNPWAPKFTWAPWGTSGVVHDNCMDYAFDSYSSKRRDKSVPGDRSGMLATGLTFTSCRGIAARVLSDNPKTVYKMKSGSETPKPGYYKVMCVVAPSNDFGNSSGDFHWYRQTSAVEYRVRPGDTVYGLAKFFRVSQSVIHLAIIRGITSSDPNKGKIADMPDELRVLNRFNLQSKLKLRGGKVITIPVKLWSHKTGWAGGPLLVDASGKTISDPRKANRNYIPGYHYTKFCSAYGVKPGMAKTGSNRNRS